VVADAAGVPARALQVARQLAQALRGTVEVAPPDHQRLAAARADLVVLSRLPDEPALLARLRCPLLRVG
jgi:predicted alpha/beta hydrolase family esterase